MKMEGEGEVDRWMVRMVDVWMARKLDEWMVWMVDEGADERELRH